MGKSKGSHSRQLSGAGLPTASEENSASNGSITAVKAFFKPFERVRLSARLYKLIDKIF